MAKGGGNNAFALLPDDNDGDIDGFINEVVAKAKIREEEMKKNQQLQEQEEAAKIKEQQKVELPRMNRDPLSKRKPSHTVFRKTKLEGVKAQAQGNVEENHKEKIGFLENDHNFVNNNHKGNYHRDLYRNSVGAGGYNGYQVEHNGVDHRRNFNGGDQKFNDGYQGDNNSVNNINGGDQGYNGNRRDNNVRNFNGVDQRYNRGGAVYHRENYRNFNRGDNGYQRPNLYQRRGDFNQQNHNDGDLQNGVVVHCDEPDAEGYIVYNGRRKGRRRFHNNGGSSEHTSTNGTDDLVQGSDNTEKKVDEESDKPEEKAVVKEGEKAAESKNGDKKKESEKADAESKKEENKKDKKEKMKKKKDKKSQATTKTYQEYEKILLAKKKALEEQLAINKMKPKAKLDEAFASMKPIGKASEKPKVSSSAESLKNREKGKEPVNITADFIKPPLRRFNRRVPQAVEGKHKNNNGGGSNVDRAPPSPPPLPPAAAAPAPPPCVTDLDQFPSL